MSHQQIREDLIGQSENATLGRWAGGLRDGPPHFNPKMTLASNG
jgi:hypothetical protein